MNITALKKFASSLRGTGTCAMLVTDGRVSCPRKTIGDVDVDGCLSCPFLSRAKLDGASGEQWIECRSPKPYLVPHAQC